jgi:hypothetical protein
MPEPPGDVESELRHAESKLNSRAAPYTDEVAIANWLKTLIATLPKQRSISSHQTQEFFAEFHNAAGRLNNSETDSDYAALLLESAANDPGLASMREDLLRHALWRATWFAQGATAGGEGIARSVHINRIKAKLDQ